MQRACIRFQSQWMQCKGTYLGNDLQSATEESLGSAIINCFWSIVSHGVVAHQHKVSLQHTHTHTHTHTHAHTHTQVNSITKSISPMLCSKEMKEQESFEFLGHCPPDLILGSLTWLQVLSILYVMYQNFHRTTDIAVVS